MSSVSDIKLIRTDFLSFEMDLSGINLYTELKCGTHVGLALTN